ncbi:hypothetical protein EDC01DRAFT_635295 [Geopyxis carbonaria]|nr:hypothetical protein EDC01DRAFT_635295 [Geopyxis carbonaria]
METASDGRPIQANQGGFAIPDDLNVFALYPGIEQHIAIIQEQRPPLKTIGQQRTFAQASQDVDRAIMEDSAYVGSFDNYYEIHGQCEYQEPVLTVGALPSHTVVELELPVGHGVSQMPPPAALKRAPISGLQLAMVRSSEPAAHMVSASAPATNAVGVINSRLIRARVSKVVNTASSVPKPRTSKTQVPKPPIRKASKASVPRLPRPKTQAKTFELKIQIRELAGTLIGKCADGSKWTCEYCPNNPDFANAYSARRHAEGHIAVDRRTQTARVRDPNE